MIALWRYQGTVNQQLRTIRPLVRISVNVSVDRIQFVMC